MGKRTHGLSKHPVYRKWADIKARCYNKNHRAYKYYGAREITMYDDWINDVKAFYDYVMSLDNAMGERLSIDRIRNNEGYKPGNLRWATYIEQANNRRDQKSKTGIKYVYCYGWRKYVVSVHVNGKTKYIGSNFTLEDAIKRRDAYLRKLKRNLA